MGEEVMQTRLCSFAQSFMMSKTHQGHELLSVSEFIFCSDPEVNGKILLVFVDWTRVAYKIPAALYV